MIADEAGHGVPEPLRAVSERQRSFPVVGKSMRPLLWPGLRVDVRPLDAAPRLGAILVYTAADGVVIHRLMHVVRDADRVRFATKGDASAREDPPLEPELVLGEVCKIHYGRFSLRVDNPLWRRLGWTASRVAPILHSIRRWMKRIV